MMAIFAAGAMAKAQSDMLLSEKLASASQAYYAVNNEAVAAYQDFRDNNDESLELKIPITGQISLYTKFEQSQITAWHVISESETPDEFIPVWDGN